MVLGLPCGLGTGRRSIGGDLVVWGNNVRDYEGPIVLTALFSLSLWLFVGLPILYGPFHSTDNWRPPIAEEQSNPAKGHETNTAGNNEVASVALTRGAPSKPLYVEATCDDQDRNAECNKGWWQKFWTDPVATFTGLLFIATFFQTIFTYWAFNESRLANLAAKKAETNTDTALILSNRPYVFVRDFVPIAVGDPNQPIGWRCVCIWENSGATPTQNLKMWVSWANLSSPIQPDFSFPDLGTPEAKALQLSHRADKPRLSYSRSLEIRQSR
jgi:hypothetical protein